MASNVSDHSLLFRGDSVSCKITVAFMGVTMGIYVCISSNNKLSSSFLLMQPPNTSPLLSAP